MIFRRATDGSTLKPLLQKVAILGGGPVGLEAALTAKSAGYDVTVYESGAPGEFVGRWGHIRMFTPFGMNTTANGKQAIKLDHPKTEFPADTDILTGKEYREKYLIPLAESSTLEGVVKSKQSAVTIGRVGWRKTDLIDPKKPLPAFRLLIRDGATNQERFETADLVFDCTGTFARPNWIGDGGIPAAGELAARPQISFWPEEILGAKKAHYAGKSVVVIGGGYSAATAVCDLMTLAESQQATWVIWLTNGPKAQPLPRYPNDPYKERDKLAVRANALALRCDGNLEYHAQTFIEELISHGPDKGFRVAGRVAGRPRNWDIERVIALVGYRPDPSVCQELRVGDPNGNPFTGEPGYFILGAKSKGRDSGFLIREGIEQINSVMASLGSKAKAA
ncbi:MAG: FAD-dependent oxidoreductase [Gemmataceae bacterium]